jgi:hypothetical protein
MKRFFKILAYGVGALVLLLGIGVAYIYFDGIPNYTFAPTPAIANLKVVPDSIRVERGAKIASLLCNECHKDNKTGKLTGRLMPDLPKEFGVYASLNITHDVDHGFVACCLCATSFARCSHLHS